MKKYPQPYSTQRELRDAIRADKEHLKNAPLGAKKKKELARVIELQQAQLREVNAYIREQAKKKKKI